MPVPNAELVNMPNSIATVLVKPVPLSASPATLQKKAKKAAKVVKKCNCEAIPKPCKIPGVHTAKTPVKVKVNKKALDPKLGGKGSVNRSKNLNSSA
jgi:hypothetical protein